MVSRQNNQSAHAQGRRIGESARLSDNEFNSGQKDGLEGLGQWECSRKPLRHIRFPFAVVRTTAPSLSVQRPVRDSIRPGRSHSRCCRSDDRAALPENRDRAVRSLDRQDASRCASVQYSGGGARESEGMNVLTVSIHGDKRHVQGDAAIDQGMTLSEVPRRRQFWQSIQFQVSKKSLHGFRSNWHTSKNRHLITGVWSRVECGSRAEKQIQQGRLCKREYVIPSVIGGSFPHFLESSRPFRSCVTIAEERALQNPGSP